MDENGTDCIILKCSLLVFKSHSITSGKTHTCSACTCREAVSIAHQPFIACKINFHTVKMFFFFNYIDWPSAAHANQYAPHSAARICIISFRAEQSAVIFNYPFYGYRFILLSPYNYDSRIDLESCKFAISKPNACPIAILYMFSTGSERNATLCRKCWYQAHRSILRIFVWSDDVHNLCNRHTQLTIICMRPIESNREYIAMRFCCRSCCRHSLRPIIPTENSLKNCNLRLYSKLLLIRCLHFSWHLTVCFCKKCRSAMHTVNGTGDSNSPSPSALEDMG